MRLLALLFALLSMPVLAAAASWADAAPASGEVLLAQQTQQKPSGSTGPSGSSGSSGSGRQGRQVEKSRISPRHPGDYCTSHCRAQRNPVRPRVHVVHQRQREMHREGHHHLRGQALS